MVQDLLGHIEDGLAAIHHPDSHFYNCKCGWSGEELFYADAKGRHNSSNRLYQPYEGFCPKCGQPFAGCFNRPQAGP
jgi:hypothetical protein